MLVYIIYILGRNQVSTEYVSNKYHIKSHEHYVCDLVHVIVYVLNIYLGSTQLVPSLLNFNYFLNTFIIDHITVIHKSSYILTYFLLQLLTPGLNPNNNHSHFVFQTSKMYEVTLYCSQVLKKLTDPSCLLWMTVHPPRSPLCSHQACRRRLVFSGRSR